MAARVLIAALPCLRRGPSRRDGTARKVFESGFSLLRLPPAARRGRRRCARRGSFSSLFRARRRGAGCCVPVLPGRGPSPPGTAWKNLKSGVFPAALAACFAAATCSIALLAAGRFARAMVCGVAALAVAIFVALFGWAAQVRVAVLTSCGRGPSRWDGMEGLGTDRFFFALAVCFAMPRGVALLAAAKCGRNSGVSKSSFPPCKGGPALGKVRLSALRLAAAFRQGCRPAIPPRVAAAARLAQALWRRGCCLPRRPSCPDRGRPRWGRRGGIPKRALFLKFCVSGLPPASRRRRVASLCLLRADLRAWWFAAPLRSPQAQALWRREC